MDYRKIKLSVLVLLLSFVVLPAHVGCAWLVGTVVGTVVDNQFKTCSTCRGPGCERCGNTGKVAK